MVALPLAKKLQCPWHGLVSKTMYNHRRQHGHRLRAFQRVGPTANHRAGAGNWPLCLMTSWRSHSRTTWPPPLSNDGQISQREPLILGLALILGILMSPLFLVLLQFLGRDLELAIITVAQPRLLRSIFGRHRLSWRRMVVYCRIDCGVALGQSLITPALTQRI